MKPLEKMTTAARNALVHVLDLTPVDSVMVVTDNHTTAKLTGNLLEDEKAYRTAHIAFGNNDEMPGGRNKSATHRDFLFYDPTFDVTFADGTSKVLIEKGEFRL